ncbi:MAG: hypothetical protein ACK41G_10235 [Candidatus Thermochlorobacter sp.]
MLDRPVGRLNIQKLVLFRFRPRYSLRELRIFVKRDRSGVAKVEREGFEHKLEFSFEHSVLTAQYHQFQLLNFQHAVR